MRDDLHHGTGGAQRFVRAMKEFQPVTVAELKEMGIDDAGHWIGKLKRDGALECCGYVRGRGQLWRLTY